MAVSFCWQAEAQDKSIKSDSIKTRELNAKSDSIKIKDVNTKDDSLKYKAIENFAQKSKVAKLVHPLIFRHVDSKTVRKAKNNPVKLQNPNQTLAGKIVRNIHIITLDPFGYRMEDTTRLPHGTIMKAGNDLHLKTHPWIIRNLLLFKKNEPFDTLLASESERLIRSQRYVRDVSIRAVPVDSDSVDVIVTEWDLWSITPAIGVSSSNLNLSLADNNIVGLGHRFRAEKQWNRTPGTNVTKFNYQIPNIRNSYISANFLYSFSDTGDLVKSIEFVRHFYSPLTKWAGGIYLGQTLLAQRYIQVDSVINLNSPAHIQDYWIAKSWKLFKGNSIYARTTNLIVSSRLLRARYPERPAEADPENLYNDETIYFAGIGITSRKYVKDKYIFNYRKIEDVPVGYAFGMTFGVDVQHTSRLYWGLKASWGKYHPYGYLSTFLEYGTFIENSGLNQQVVTASINYFTRLYTVGNWNVRQFVKPTLIIGLNRLATDNITFTDGMKGFEELAFSAKHMAVLTLQTQTYAPWNILGFHFGPFIFTSLGVLSNGAPGLSLSRLYSSVGIGVLVINDYLMFNTFQVSLTFYPSLPGSGNNIFKTNAYRSSDFGFRDFEISKPVVVNYR